MSHAPETFSILDGAWIGRICYPDARTESHDLSCGPGSDECFHRERHIWVPVGRYILSVTFGSGTYSANHNIFNGAEFNEIPSSAEIAVVLNGRLVGDSLLGWDDTVLGYQTPAEVNAVIAQLRKMP